MKRSHLGEGNNVNVSGASLRQPERQEGGASHHDRLDSSLERVKLLFKCSEDGIQRVWSDIHLLSLYGSGCSTSRFEMCIILNWEPQAGCEWRPRACETSILLHAPNGFSR